MSWGGPNVYPLINNSMDSKPPINTLPHKYFQRPKYSQRPKLEHWSSSVIYKGAYQRISIWWYAPLYMMMVFLKIENILQHCLKICTNTQDNTASLFLFISFSFFLQWFKSHRFLWRNWIWKMVRWIYRYNSIHATCPRWSWLPEVIHHWNVQLASFCQLWILDIKIDSCRSNNLSVSPEAKRKCKRLLQTITSC